MQCRQDRRLCHELTLHHEILRPTPVVASQPITPPLTNVESQTATTVAAPLLGVVVDRKMRITEFLPDSVLPSHGVAPGDVVNSIEDHLVRNPEELSAAMSAFTKGMKVKIGIMTRGLWQSWVYVQL